MDSVNLSDIEIAFKFSDDASLRRAYRLFRLIQSPVLVKAGKFLLPVAEFLRIPYAWILKPTVFKHFCGGEDLAECERTFEELHQRSIFSIPDYSAEGKTDEAFMETVMHEVLKVIDQGARDPRVAFAVFKPSGLIRSSLMEKSVAGQTLTEGESIALERGRSRFEQCCAHAFSNGIPLLIDAEESWIQAFVDDLSLQMMRRYNVERPIVYNTIQLYRIDGLQRMKDVMATAKNEGFVAAFKLVRGAYMEKERKRALSRGEASPIHSDKMETDRSYNAALKLGLENISHTAILAGTHNEESNLLLCKLMEELGCPHNHPFIFFSQLYGMSDHISQNLAHAGYRVAKYVPYGALKTVLPYLIRRAEENTAMAGQTGREMGIIRAEMQRRKKKSG